MATEERIGRGEPPGEAAEAARREFGNVGLVAEVTRDAWGWRWLDHLTRDVRHSLRMMRRSPGFVAVAVASLALGIGANSTMFSMFNSLLWRPLPVASPDRLVVAYTQGADEGRFDGFSFLELGDYQRAGVLEDMSLVASWNFALRVSPGESVQITGEPVSGHYFSLLGPRMQLGRGIRPDEGSTPGRDPVAVLAHRLWVRLFNSDPGIVGRTITLNGRSLTVVGVAGPEFRGTWSVFVAPDIWVPVTMIPTLFPAFAAGFESRDDRSFRLLGRLPPGTTVAQAAVAMSRVASRLAAEHPETNRGRGVRLYRELDTRPQIEVAGAAGGVAFAFLAVTALVLVNACANVTSLLLARAASRRREVAMRLALGASRGQLVRQMLIEAALLSLPAGAAGLLVANAASRLLGAMRLPSEIPIVFETHTDLRVALFTLAVSLVAGIAFGLVPALRAARSDLVPALKGAPPRDDRRRRGPAAGGLVVGQVAVSLLLLVVAGLFLRSIAASERMNPGFATERRLAADFVPSMVGYDAERAASYYRALIERVRGLPGVRSAALVGHMPLDHSSHSTDLLVEGRIAEPGRERIQTNFSVVDQAYFRTAGTAIVRGRGFTENDAAGSLPVVVVNETFARRYWPGQNPIGKRIREASPGSPFREVIGVAADGKYLALFEPPLPYLFLPWAQRPVTDMMLIVEHRGDEAGTARALRQAAAASDPAMPLFGLQTLEAFMRTPRALPRGLAAMVVPAALLAALLAALGLYGALAHAVSRRAREVGIRMAVGAGARNVLGLVLRQGFALTAAGLAIGLALALATTRLLSGLLLGTSATDPLVFIAAPALLALVAALASWVPMRQALRVDPLQVLRQE